MTPFTDTLQHSITRTQSCLVAGCDPVIEKMPSFLVDRAAAESPNDDSFFERILKDFCSIFVSAIAGRVAAAKPNIAFFEQYGIPGLRALCTLCTQLRAHSIPIIMDAKRGDIGTTAAAYSAAFLGHPAIRGKRASGFDCDALTVNPFLGFDTLEPFVKDCCEHGKGIFILVQTSNPGAKDLQGLHAAGSSVSEHVAHWIAKNEAKLRGTCGWSGLGAVVGASYPDEARHLRELMPRSFFLIPGLGAQGADARDSVAGFGSLDGVKGGALVNVSRGLLEGSASSADELQALVQANVARCNTQLREALAVAGGARV